MLIRSTTGPLYPVFVTKLLVNEDDEIPRDGPLFNYYYREVVDVVNKNGKTKQKVVKQYGTMRSEQAGILKSWTFKFNEDPQHVESNRIQGPGAPIAELDEPCKHEVQFGGVCAECGKDVTVYSGTLKDTDRATVNMTHSNTALKISLSEAQRISSEVKRRLVDAKKLSLVVDLDQTIIHATVEPTIAEWKADTNNPNYEAVKDVGSFELEDSGGVRKKTWYHIKPRPGLPDFLKEMAQLYELHVYTMGTRQYADNVMKIVDPDSIYFSNRVLSRDESGSVSAKDLRRLFPIDDSMVVIIDDRGDVWNWDAHLMKVHPFVFFIGTGDLNSSFLPKRPEERAVKKTDTPKKKQALPEPPAEKPEEVSSENGQEQSPEKIQEGAPEETTAETTNGDAPPPTAASNEKASTDTNTTEANNGPESEAPKVEEASPAEANPVSGLSKQMNKMGSTDDAALLQEQKDEQNEALEALLSDRPLLQKQMQLDKIDEENAKKEQEDGTTTPPQKRHHLLNNDDNELEYLGRNLARIHEVFFEEHERNKAPPPDARVAKLKGEELPAAPPTDEDIVPNIEVLLPQMKRQVLKGVVIVFSGVVPRGIPVKDSEIAVWASSFGATVDENVTKHTTHLVAARKGTTKIHEARRRRKAKIVTIQWLHDSLTRFERMNEDDYLLLDPNEQTRPAADATAILEEQFDVSSTEQTGAEDEADEPTDTATDGETAEDGADAAPEFKPEMITEDTWGSMEADLAAFLEGDDEDGKTDTESRADEDRASEAPEDSEAEGDESNITNGDGEELTPNGSKKRKRNEDEEARESDADESDASNASSIPESKLQRRKKRAFERVTSLTNVTIAAGLLTPEGTAMEAPKEGEEEGEAMRDGEDDYGFEDAFAAALEEAE